VDQKRVLSGAPQDKPTRGRSPTWSCAAAKADFRGQRLERPAWQGELDSTETFPHHQRLWITYKSIILGCAMQIGIVLARSEDLP
jgi:hypothetical protein